MTLFNLKCALLSSFAVLPFTNSATLVANLSQNQTNGNSQLGTVNAPTLPQFLSANTIPPWGSKTTYNTDPYDQCAPTGVTRTYNFVLERGFKAPDGFNRSVIMINGQIPGPTIEANWCDTIQVTVTNNLPDEGTSLHWHGLLQTETPWFDGVPSVQQCPIAPGSSFTYSFLASLYGTSWYHSHYSAQYADGLSGPLIIYGPTTNAPRYDIDLGPVFLNDWYHENTSFYLGPPAAINPASDNNLINGKGNFDCAELPSTECVPDAGLSTFNFTSGKTHRLRLINAGAAGLQRFTIDGYQMLVIANDFVPIEPYNTTMVTLGVGQRTDVLVVGTGEPTDAVWMRSNISTLCSPSNGRDALAAIFYENANVTQQPTTTATFYEDLYCRNDPLNMTVPVSPHSPIGTPATTQEIDITLNIANAKWSMNNSTFKANYNYSLLDLAYQGNTSYPNDPQWNVYDFGSNSSIRIILYNHSPASHPMHLHGHNFWILAEGVGDWDGSVNLQNPQRRDTQLVQPSAGALPGYSVLQFDADNPGVWPFHCHIAWHVSGGLYVNVLERPGDITQAQIPSVTNQTCQAWAAYSAQNAVDEIDSGL